MWHRMAKMLSSREGLPELEILMLNAGDLGRRPGADVEHLL